MRRIRSNSGPGVPGIGHIAVFYRVTALRSTEALCGRVLVGDLDWEDRAEVQSLAPDGWRCCRICFLSLKTLDAPSRDEGLQQRTDGPHETSAAS